MEEILNEKLFFCGVEHISMESIYGTMKLSSHGHIGAYLENTRTFKITLSTKGINSQSVLTISTEGSMSDTAAGSKFIPDTFSDIQ